MDVDVLNFDASFHLSRNKSRVDRYEEGRYQSRLFGSVVGVVVGEDVARRTFGCETGFLEQLSAGSILRAFARVPFSAR